MLFEFVYALNHNQNNGQWPGFYRNDGHIYTSFQQNFFSHVVWAF